MGKAKRNCEVEYRSEEQVDLNKDEPKFSEHKYMGNPVKYFWKAVKELFDI